MRLGGVEGEEEVEDEEFGAGVDFVCGASSFGFEVVVAI